MPRRAPHPCAHPGCASLVQPGKRFCSRHQSEEWRKQNARRPSPAEQGYDARWRKISDRFVADHPICQRCRRAPSKIAHHILRKSKGGSDDPFNLMALCPMCHAQVHAAAKELFGRDR